MPRMYQPPPEHTKPLKQYIHAIEKKANLSWTQNKWVQPNESTIEDKSLKLKNSYLMKTLLSKKISKPFAFKNSFS